MNWTDNINLIKGGKQDYPYWKSLENRFNVTLFVDKSRLQWRKFSIRKKGKIVVSCLKKIFSQTSVKGSDDNSVCVNNFGL